MTDEGLRDILHQVADNRSASHAGHASTLKLSANYDRCGLAGEWAFARDFNQPLDCARAKIGGDGGIDFCMPLMFSIDVKTFRKPGHLLVTQGKVVADIYVLAGYAEDILNAELLGWEWRDVIVQAPVRDFGGGIASHYIARGLLQPISELRQRAAILGFNIGVVP